MPLTEFQRGVARVIAANRNPGSHIAGGAVINRGADGLRISDDLDIFNDMFTVGQHTADFAVASAELDAKTLRESGYSVEWTFRNTGLYRAVISRDKESVRIDWTTDPAFRFFPALEDEEFGYSLHPADLAVNKVLALVGRAEVRDFLDILQLDRKYLSLGTMIWAACGKDEGYTPSMIIDHTNRHSSYREADLSSANLVHSVDLKSLKRQWIAARENALTLFSELPRNEIGCLYLNQNNEPVTPNVRDSEFANLKRHRGSVCGAWPART